ARGGNGAGGGSRAVGSGTAGAGLRVGINGDMIGDARDDVGDGDVCAGTGVDRVIVHARQAGAFAVGAVGAVSEAVGWRLLDACGACPNDNETSGASRNFGPGCSDGARGRRQVKTGWRLWNGGERAHVADGETEIRVLRGARGAAGVIGVLEADLEREPAEIRARDSADIDPGGGRAA